MRHIHGAVCVDACARVCERPNASALLACLPASLLECNGCLPDCHGVHHENLGAGSCSITVYWSTRQTTHTHTRTPNCYAV